MKVTAQELNAEVLKRKYLHLLENPDIFPSKKNWSFIIENNMYELALPLYKKYLTALSIEESERGTYHNDTIEIFPNYLEYIPRRYAIKALYSDTSTNAKASTELAIKLNLFDIDGILDMLDRNEVRAAARMLMAMKPSYDTNDLDDLKDLLDDFLELPELGHYEGNSIGLLSSGERYICPKGHVNKENVEFCTHEGCNLNIKGLTPTEVECIDNYAQRIEILEEMLLSPKRARE